MSHQRSFFDQLSSSIAIQYPPARIISLVPSQTELLFDLGLDQQVVGITKFCVHPPLWEKEKAIVGGTKNFRFDTIQQLNPDLIIGNKEENYKEGIDQLRKNYPVWMSDIITFYDALEMIRMVGELSNKEVRAFEIINQINESFQKIRPRKLKRVLYLIWRNPWMAAGPQTFIHTMIERIGWINCVKASRYPAISSDEIKEMDPEIILLSSEPYPFEEKHTAELQKIAADAKIMLVDGEMFSWYGSRLLKAPAYFNTLID